MLNYIKGILEEKAVDKIVVENNGIGYEILTSLNTIEGINIGEKIKIHTKLLVREDDIQLVGFTSKEELSMFNLLTSVSKIGPKLALSSLSVYKSEKIKLMIVESDVNSLVKIPGMGKKTAERVILELKDKIGVVYFTDLESYSEPQLNIGHQAIEALISLGFSKKESEDVVKKIIKSVGNDTESLDVETLIKNALFELR